MARKYAAVRECTRLQNGLVAEVVENYLRDREALVIRNNIKGRIQRHKIAGLMAAAIVKLRPVQLLDDTGKAARVSKDNETLAVLHGLGICAEGNEERVLELLRLPMFGTWYEDFIYQLRRRPDCAEWASLVFETLSLMYFPENLQRISEMKDEV
jgi:hypothetical protein